MNPRPLARMRCATAETRAMIRRFAVIIAVCSIGLVSLTGCDPRQALYFFQPFEPKVPAPCPSLKEKKVVILTTTVPGVALDFISIDREISKQLTQILRENIKKITVVDPSEVADWAQAKPTWTDPVEAAKAFDADVVILLEIREFQIQDPSSPGLFEGRSEIHIKAIELAHPKDDRGKEIVEQPKEANTLYDGDRSTAYPVTGHIALDSGQSPAVFRNAFLKRVVEEVSWAFVDHSVGDNIQDTRFN